MFFCYETGVFEVKLTEYGKISFFYKIFLANGVVKEENEFVIDCMCRG